jgi:hypothetical protein
LWIRARDNRAEYFKSELTSSAAANKSEIVEFCNLIFHYCGAISQLSVEVFVVTTHYCDWGAVEDITERHYFEGYGKGFVGAPMLRQYGTDLWQLNHYNYLNVAGWDNDI